MIDIILEQVQANPEDAKVWQTLGFWYLKNRETDDYLQKAKESYLKALALDSELEASWAPLIEIHFKLDEFDEGRAVFEKVKSDFKLNTTVWKYGGLIYQFGFNDMQTAKECYNHALRFELEDAELWFRVAYAYEWSEDFDLALSAYKTCLEHDPQYATAWHNIGKINETHFNNMDYAEECLLKSVEIKPDYTFALYSLAYHYNLRKDFDQSEIYMKQVLNLNPEYVDALTGMAILSANKYEDFEACEAYLRKALAVNPNEKSAWNLLGRLYEFVHEDQALANEYYEKGE